MWNFFISYNRADRSWAEWIAWHLEEVGYTTVLQAWDFLPGSNFVQAMDEATKCAEQTIAVLSPSYLSAKFTHPEWQAAFAQDPTGEFRKLIPVRVEECDLKGLLGQIVYIDFVGFNEEDAKNALLKGVQNKSVRIKPASKPPFPIRLSNAIPEIVSHSVNKPNRFPGTLPSVFNVPHLRNPNFIGRDDLLSELHGDLTSGRPATEIQTISGLGGVGKTHLVLEYIFRYAAEYDTVWWLRSEDEATLIADMVSLAWALDLENKEAEQRVVLSDILNWLRLNKHWLLVFDNARVPSIIRKYIPQISGGHIIITSRNPNWRGIASQRSVPILDRNEAVDLLMRRTNHGDQSSAHQLAALLGDLPLALEQAGAYIEETGRDISSYIELFHDHQESLLNLGSSFQESPSTISTIWEISFKQVEIECSASAELINICAFLAPEGIPLELFKEGAEYLPQCLYAASLNPIEFDKTIATLRRYSLVEKKGEDLSVHRLVQAAARIRMSGEVRRQVAEIALRLVTKMCGAYVHYENNRGQYTKLLSHTLVVTGHTKALNIALSDTSLLLTRTGLSSYVYKDLRLELERRLIIAEATSGHDHPTVIDIQINLINILKELGEEIACNRAIAKLASTYRLMGEALFRQNKIAQAEELYSKALELDHGPGREGRAAADYRKLGRDFLTQGALTVAERLFDKAMELDQEDGREARAAADYRSLGAEYLALRELKKAERLFNKAMEFDKEPGQEARAAADYRSLGAECLARGEESLAARLFNKAMELDQEDGREARAAADFRRLGAKYISITENPIALRLFDKAMEFDKEPGREERATADYRNLGAWCLARGKLRNAVGLFKKAIEMDQEDGREARAAADYRKLGHAYLEVGENFDADLMFKMALIMDQKIGK